MTLAEAEGLLASLGIEAGNRVTIETVTEIYPGRHVIETTFVNDVILAIRCSAPGRPCEVFPFHAITRISLEKAA